MALLPGLAQAGQFDEQVRWTRLASGVRVFVDAPPTLSAAQRLLVVYATPNGNTIEQTLGCQAARDLDWRFDIQHVAAQMRRVREIDRSRDIIFAVVQAPQLSWPTFRHEQSGAGEIIRDLMHSLVKEFAADRVALTCHSGGGSFVWGCLNAFDTLPAWLERIVFLDANYSYSDEEGHGDKLLAWLGGDSSRRLVVIAYDDREITFQGKKVVGADGGTFRASQRMLTRFRRDIPLEERAWGPFQHTSGHQGQIQFFIHPNPDNKILHTALVGDMNGLLQGLLLGTNRAESWGKFGGPRAYTSWVQSRPFVDPAAAQAVIAVDAEVLRLALPPRPADAPTGSQFEQQIAPLPRDQREAAIAREIVRGNIPDFLRQLIPLRVQGVDTGGERHSALYYVTADYLAVGTNADSFRLPLAPRSILKIARQLDAAMITTKISEDVFAAAQLRLAPRPLTQDRDKVPTFFQHHRIIEEQLGDKPRGQLVAGIKKDIVLTNRLREKPHKVAIYGWHYPDGRPIQPLYVGHVDWYVDYSHGVRLVAERVVVDGRPQRFSAALKDPQLCALFSNEGPIDAEAVWKSAAW